MDNKGKIGAQLIALALLALSISLVISSYKSLGREFRGIIIDKTEESAIIANYWLYLINQEETTASESRQILIRQRKSSTATKRIGVSRIVYRNAEPFQHISKQGFSPFILLDKESHLDLGLHWLILGCFGIAAAVFCHIRSNGKI